MEVILEPGWVNTFIALVTFVTMVLGLLIGYLFRSAKEFSEYKADAARTYATKDELNLLGDRIERTVGKEFDRLYDLLQKREAA